MVYESILCGALQNSEFLQISNLNSFPSHSTTDQRYSERFPAFQPEPAGSWRKWADHDSRWSLLLQQSEQRDWRRRKGTCYNKTTVHLRTTGGTNISDRPLMELVLYFLDTPFAMAEHYMGTHQLQPTCPVEAGSSQKHNLFPAERWSGLKHQDPGLLVHMKTWLKVYV